MLSIKAGAVENHSVYYMLDFYDEYSCTLQRKELHIWQKEKEEQTISIPVDWRVLDSDVSASGMSFYNSSDGSIYCLQDRQMVKNGEIALPPDYDYDSIIAQRGDKLYYGSERGFISPLYCMEDSTAHLLCEIEDFGPSSVSISPGGRVAIKRFFTSQDYIGIEVLTSPGSFDQAVDDQGIAIFDRYDGIENYVWADDDHLYCFGRVKPQYEHFEILYHNAYDTGDPWTRTPHVVPRHYTYELICYSVAENRYEICTDAQGKPIRLVDYLILGKMNYQNSVLSMIVGQWFPLDDMSLDYENDAPYPKSYGEKLYLLSTETGEWCEVFSDTIKERDMEALWERAL